MQAIKQKHRQDRNKQDRQTRQNRQPHLQEPASSTSVWGTIARGTEKGTAGAGAIRSAEKKRKRESPPGPPSISATARRCSPSLPTSLTIIHPSSHSLSYPPTCPNIRLLLASIHLPPHWPVCALNHSPLSSFFQHHSPAYPTFQPSTYSLIYPSAHHPSFCLSASSATYPPCSYPFPLKLVYAEISPLTISMPGSLSIYTGMTAYIN